MSGPFDALSKLGGLQGATAGAAAQLQAQAAAQAAQAERVLQQGSVVADEAAFAAAAGHGAASDVAAAGGRKPYLLKDSTRARFDQEVNKYPPEQRISAVMACLAIIQQEEGYVAQDAEAVLADYIGVAPIAVHEVTTFYNMYNQQPLGRYKFNVCTNLPCALRGGGKAMEHLCSKLGVQPYGTTADGLFTVQPSECQGACADAPVMLVNDRQMLSFMSNDKLDEMVELLRKA